ncbi:hypothetical protein XENOCAPTIV_010696 [Xenoophorus captivus]|uniref:Uncharacterized protein n=1 Tax=Xenoophorus captivus TaxID=1517983 RepID=A0ABV0RSF2_9TELE
MSTVDTSGHMTDRNLLPLLYFSDCENSSEGLKGLHYKDLIYKIICMNCNACAQQSHGYPPLIDLFLLLTSYFMSSCQFSNKKFSVVFIMRLRGTVMMAANTHKVN